MTPWTLKIVTPSRSMARRINTYATAIGTAPAKRTLKRQARTKRWELNMTFKTRAEARRLKKEFSTYAPRPALLRRNRKTY